MSGLVAVLGAGRGRRFGADKLAMPCAGAPVGLWAVRTAQRTGWPTILVTGPAGAPWAADNDVRCVANPDPASGLGTSLACAARMARAEGAARLLILLADMPLVTDALCAALIAARAPAATRQADGRPGVPAMVPAHLFDALATLTGDAGAGRILGAQPDLTLVTADKATLHDVDTPGDLSRIAAALGA